MTLVVEADWRVRAACSSDPEGQFPDNNAEEIAAAKRVCTGCPVREQCLASALALNEREGVWGGFTYAERRNLVAYGVAQRHVRPKAECPRCGRQVAIEGEGLRRHNRPDPKGAKGYSACTESKS